MPFDQYAYKRRIRILSWNMKQECEQKKLHATLIWNTINIFQIPDHISASSPGPTRRNYEIKKKNKRKEEENGTCPNTAQLTDNINKMFYMNYNNWDWDWDRETGEHMWQTHNVCDFESQCQPTSPKSLCFWIKISAKSYIESSNISVIFLCATRSAHRDNPQTMLKTVGKPKPMGKRWMV